MAAIPIALLSALFFGAALVLTQFGLRYLPPLRGAAVSVPVTAVFFVFLSPVLVDWTAASWTGGLIFACVGLFFPVAVTVLTFRSNQTLGPNITGGVGNLAPLFAVLFAVFVLGESATVVQAIGIGVIVAGVSLLFMGRGNGAGWSVAALLLPLLAAIIRGLVQPAVKFGLQSWADPFAAALIGYLVSAGVILLFVRLKPPSGGARLGGKGMLWFAAVGICNGLAVLTMYMALARGAVTLVAPLVATYPIAALFFSFLFLRQTRPTWMMVVGVVVTVGGVALLLVV